MLEALKYKSQYVCNNINKIFLYLIYPHSTNPTKNVELRNLFSVASLRRTKIKGISILSLVEINLTLSKVIQNLIININRTRSKIKLYDKPIDFTFPIVNFPLISSNIPASSGYGVDISQLERYSGACDQYIDFLEKSLAANAKSTATTLRCS